MQQKVAELEESYQDLEAQFNTASTLLDMDEQELVGPLRLCIYNHSASSRDPFAKKNNDKDHGRTNNANGKASEESNVEDQNNFSHIRVQPEAHMPKKGTHFNVMEQLLGDDT
ncbi:hypothetical protein V6N13_073086 [Hibiscus sabdariffa]